MNHPLEGTREPLGLFASSFGKLLHPVLWAYSLVIFLVNLLTAERIR